MPAENNSRQVRIASRGAAQGNLSGRRFATALTGGALVLALILGAAVPAKADRKDDLAKAVIAALVVGVIANKLDGKTKAPPAKPEPVRQQRVPAACAISIDGAQRSVSLYSENCLRREGFDHRLPRGCANKARIFGREDRVYSVQCLRDAGFRVQGH